MSKAIKQCELVDWPDEMDQMYGRNWVRKMFTAAERFDLMQYRHWLWYLESLAIGAFKWSNVPAGIDARAMEYILLHFGQGALFMDEGGMLFAAAAPADNINMYWNPNKILLTAPNGQTWERHCESWVLADGEGGHRVMHRDAVMCFDNMRRFPLYADIRNYARRLARIDAILDVNHGAQRTPYIVVGSEEGRNSRRDVIRKLESNEQYIQMNSELSGNLGMVDVLQTVAPYVADKLLSDKQKILNEAVTMLGIDNTNNEKRERMIDAEATSNNEQIMVMRRNRLEERRKFCIKANTIFQDLDMWVEWGVPHERTDIDAKPLGGKQSEDGESEPKGGSAPTGGEEQ